MQRKRTSLGPIGDAVPGMGGPIQALREAAPPAFHHFTLADQVDQLAAAREADPDRGFMARTMALCSLPRSNPGNRTQYRGLSSNGTGMYAKGCRPGAATPPQVQRSGPVARAVPRL